MKKLIVVLLLIAVLLTLCSCDSKGVKLYQYGMNEWVSPDGVHYWIYHKGNGLGLAPRYDKNGELIID